MADLAETARRKERLIARCAAQRDALAGVLRDLERPIAVADRALAIARFFRAHPALVFVAAAILVAFRRRGALGLLGRGLAVWRAWRSISGWAGRMGMEFPRGRRRERAGDVAS